MFNLNAHERTQWAKCAQALYARGCNAEGHLMSAAASKPSLTVEQFDRAAHVYRVWLCFDEPKPASEWPALGALPPRSERGTRNEQQSPKSGIPSR